MNNDLKQRLALSLLFCRLAVFVVFLIWTYDKLARPEHGIHMLKKFYYFPASLAEAVVILFGVVELVLLILFVLGYFKKFTRGIFLFLSVLAVAMPKVVLGYYNAIFVEAHPTILYFTGFCLLACAFAVYYLRDYDTLFSLDKKTTTTA